MPTLLRLIILRNWRSLVILFSVILFASTGFLTMRELTTNIEVSIARETRPIFGADLRIYHEGLASRSLIETFAPYLSESEYSWAEIRDFSTTLIDASGKTGLVRVIAYTGDYPQKGILETAPVVPIEKGKKISASDDLLSKYSSGGIIQIDGRYIEITDRITKSSDMGFSFASENSLIILPLESLSGSLLISSGSRLDHDLLVSFVRESDAERVSAEIRKDEQYKEYRTRTFAERSEQNLDIVDQVTDYILLILLVSVIFASIVMRSAHDRLFASLRETLRITEILGLTRARQMGLFALVYSVIIPLAWILSVGLSYIIITLIARLPDAEGFVFLASPVWFSIAILALLVIASFWPAWQSRLGISLGSILRYAKSFLPCHSDDRKNLLSMKKGADPSFLRMTKNGILQKLVSRYRGYDIITPIVLFVSVVIAIYLIFSSVLISLIIGFTGLALIIVLSLIIAGFYRLIFLWIGRYRLRYFGLYDALRTHVRPLTPSVPVTLSLLAITVSFIVFLLFSLSFQSRLSVSVDQTANIYAINILEQDRAKVEKYLSGSGDIYSILRARIKSVNGQSLAEHLGTPKPTGEFTREYNITTSPLENRIIRGKAVIAPDEVSMDSDFAGRLGVDIGDRIEFLLSGKSISLTIASIRDSKREGFAPFFYFSFDPDTFRTAPKTYFVSAYASDTEQWKKSILANSGPHVTFIDIENLLTIIRDISGKILSVITLFLGFISIFALFAIVALFGEMRQIESLRARLYPLFGMTLSRIRSSLSLTRMSIFALALIISLATGLGIYGYLVSRSSFITMSLSGVAIVVGVVIVVYGVLIFVLKPKR